MTAPPPDSLERLTQAELIGVVGDLIGEVTRLRAENEKLVTALAHLRIEHQAIQDELARLKGLPPRPPLEPSGMDKSTDAKTPETSGEKKRSLRRRGSQLDKSKIGATVVVKADPPAGSRNKGFEDIVVQELQPSFPSATCAGEAVLPAPQARTFEKRRDLIQNLGVARTGDIGRGREGEPDPIVR